MAIHWVQIMADDIPIIFGMIVDSNLSLNHIINAAFGSWQWRWFIGSHAQIIPMLRRRQFALSIQGHISIDAVITAIFKTNNWNLILFPFDSNKNLKLNIDFKIE